MQVTVIFSTESESDRAALARLFSGGHFGGVGNRESALGLTIRTHADDPVVKAHFDINAAKDAAAQAARERAVTLEADHIAVETKAAAVKADRKAKAKRDEQPEPETTTEQPEPETADEQPEPEATKEAVMALAVKAVTMGKRGAVVAKLKEFGAAATSSLAPKHYGQMHAFLTDLTGAK